MDILSVKDIPVQGKRVFLRVDFNVPLDGNGNVLDDSRIRASLPTINYLREKGARLILASHLGRPKGKVVEELRLNGVAERLSMLLGRPVQKSDEVVGAKSEKLAAELLPGAVLFLENLRFEPGEEKNDGDFAASLARLADVFVNDAFGTVHRAHASTCGLAQYLPAAAGLLMEKEMINLEKSKEEPARPLLAILGGKKVADKIGVICSFFNQVDILLLGGAMANTFFKARGWPTGKSLVEEDKVDMARRILDEASAKKFRLCLPRDIIVVEELSAHAPFQVVEAGAIPSNMMAVDIGPATVGAYGDMIKEARTILWNGPLGAYEYPPFNRGTEETARAVAGSSALSIAGGGDITAVLQQTGLAEKFTHLSTGGGAVLDFWEGKELPGLAVLRKKQ